MEITLIVLIVLSVLVASLVWTSFVGAPWVPTSMSMVRKMLEMADVGSDDVVYDLGCGDGRVLITAARRYGARAVGFEIDPLRYLWCHLMIWILGLRDRIQVVFGDFFNKDLSDASVVACYLLQSTNEKLETKLEAELRPGTRVVSNTFTFPNFDKVREDGDARLYLVNFGT
jgi:SAM-dependent methyltransferase